jgi:DNA-binding CsgD family transcriptional regulator
MKGIDLENNFSLTSSNHVKEICDPILNPIGITYFNYIKIYNSDCSREILTNKPEWINHFYKNELYNSVGAIDVEHLLPKGYFLWSEVDSKDIIYQQGREFYNIDNGITFVVKRKDTTILYIFAANRDDFAINNFYAGNIDLLQRFIHYFTNQAQCLIKEAEENRIYLPKPQQVNTGRVNNIILSDSLRNDFLRKTETQKYYLINASDNLYLTKKQAEYAALFIKGQSAKQIARTMAVSFRTVEGHLQDIKIKIQESLQQNLTKEQLVQILRGANIH